MAGHRKLSAQQAALLAVFCASLTQAADQPQWGAAWSRNMVSEEKGLPETVDPATGRNVKWVVRLGTQTHSTPIVARGRVFIGTNNDRPKNPRHRGDCGVLLCLDESSGKLLWQLVVPKRGPTPFWDWPHTGMVSPATVEGDRVYMVSNRGEIMCLDIDGMADGNDGPFRDEGRHMARPGRPPEPIDPTDADILWLYDAPKELGVRQHDGAHCSILIDGNVLYACTSNGVDDRHMSIEAPDAPCLIALDKRDGRLLARDRERIAVRTIHCNWAPPSLAETGGRRLILYGGGDAVCYAFKALSEPLPKTPVALEKVWQYDCDPEAPKENIFRWQENHREGPSIITGMPVFYNGRVYVTAGGDYWHGKRKSWLRCFRADGRGDVTRAAAVWSFPMNAPCMNTPAIRNGLVYVADARGGLHCLEEADGRLLWTQELGGDVWSSPLVADGKIYIGTRRGWLWILRAGRRKEVLCKVRLGAPISGTATAANGVVYVATMTRLFALAKGAGAGK
ncbi:MAG: PQQ-binding-like beta-propeller repeat protein [Verrucomicrobia bacterium]|nr:PQQ-binding-like beta-propeller repeat protein [Verrucomicrobiota bacterium]